MNLYVVPLQYPNGDESHRQIEEPRGERKQFFIFIFFFFINIFSVNSYNYLIMISVFIHKQNEKRKVKQ